MTGNRKLIALLICFTLAAGLGLAEGALGLQVPAEVYDLFKWAFGLFVGGNSWEHFSRARTVGRDIGEALPQPEPQPEPAPVIEPAPVEAPKDPEALPPK